MSVTAPTVSDLFRLVADLTGTTDLAGLLTAAAAGVDQRVAELEADRDHLLRRLAVATGRSIDQTRTAELPRSDP